MLTQEERQKIEEEEKLRSEIREKHNKPSKKKTSIFTWIVLVGIVGIAILMMIPNNSAPTTEQNKPKARDLDAEISSNNQGITVVNKENAEWSACNIRLNVYWKAYANFKSGKNFISYDDLVKDGSERFNWYATKPTDINIQCKEPYGIIQGIF